MRGLQAAELIWGLSLGHQQQLGNTHERFGEVSSEHCHHWQGTKLVHEGIRCRTRLGRISALWDLGGVCVRGN